MKLGMIVKYDNDYYKVVKVLSKKRGDFQHVARVDKTKCTPFIYWRDEVYYDITFNMFTIPYERAL